MPELNCEVYDSFHNPREFPSLHCSLASLHTKHSATDGFLYLHYSSQEVYG